MRTLFEDTIEKDNRDEDPRGRALSIGLWLFALFALAGSYGAYYWITHRKPPVPPPPPVSLDDDRQISDTLTRFNGFVQAGNWDEAQKMLSTEALARLEQEKKSLRESLLEERKDQPVIAAAPTESRARTPSTVRVDCAYYFPDRQPKIIPLVLVKENDRLAINSW